jgi:hypothetical protein
MSARLVLGSSAVALVSVVAAALAPAALGSQGGHYVGSLGDGSRANITGSAGVPSAGGVIATARVQNSGVGGLIQFGHLKQGSGFGSNCGPPGTIGYMVEHKAVGGSYLCDAYFGSFGSNQKFSVLRGASGWSAYLNGALFAGPYALGFSSGGNPFSVGEFNGSAPTSYTMTFGPSGGTPWQWTVNQGSTWNTITSAATFNDGGWIVGAVPSPFNISR